MRKPGPVIDPDKCLPDQCNCGICCAVLVCSMKTLVQEESDEMPFLLRACKGCGKCVIACPLKAISLA
ncbi:MAG: 4Fe-4S binding protein [Spirochaetales bacterium]|nr:4Fe-4S binding protein [Spirochaetales bacterium]